MKKAFKSLLLAFTTMIVSTVAFAQVTTSSISGRVVDQSGDLSVDRGEMASDAHFLHDSERILVCQVLYSGDPIIYALSMIR